MAFGNNSTFSEEHRIFERLAKSDQMTETKDTSGDLVFQLVSPKPCRESKN